MNIRVALVLVLAFSSIRCSTPNPVIEVPQTGERLVMLSERYFAIKNKYVDPVSASQLAVSAINGMEELSKHLAIPPRNLLAFQPKQSRGDYGP